MADARNPSGRRPPVLPLPAPPDEGLTTTSARPRRSNRRIAASDVTSELPRLPEVELHDEASEEVRVDHRALSPGKSSLSGARAHPAGVVHPHITTRAGRPTASEKPRPQIHARSAMQPQVGAPRPPPRSQGPRVTTAEFSSLIGGRYQIVSRIGQGGMGKVYKVT
ncbi:MAG: hypothetical protein ABI867_33105, partial [Kofleriaceae bacterium]